LAGPENGSLWLWDGLLADGQEKLLNAELSLADSLLQANLSLLVPWVCS
jgi:hypothetical protein